MTVEKVDFALDRQLAEICGRLPLLYLLTPVNVADMRRQFLAGAIDQPEFRYREIPDLDAISDELTAIAPESATDPILGHMIRDMHLELQRRIELLRSRSTDRFLMSAVENYGLVEPSLLDLAQRILDTVEPGPPTSERLTATVVAERARLELDHYGIQHEELAARVHVSATAAGVMVENGDLFIGADTTVAATRIDQLIQHEVGVHVLTYVNGSAQPIRMLAVGLPGYEATQEALGVLAEHLAGGLTPGRLRVLALRVLAAHSVSAHDSFNETFNLLTDQRAGRHLAFMTTMRAHRSGGITKDALYLAGLTKLLDHLREGGALDPLFVGKISLAYEPLVADLLDRGVLVGPLLVPRFLATDSAVERLDRIRDGEDILDLGVTV